METQKDVTNNTRTSRQKQTEKSDSKIGTIIK